MIKVLITDRRHASIDEERAVLEPLGVKIIDHFCETEEELIEYGKGAIGFLVSYSKITRRVMEALPDLKIVVKYGVGYDNIDTVAAAELGIYSVNVPDYCIEEVALQALSLILNGLRFTHYFAGQVRNGNWIKDPSIIDLHRPSNMKMGFIGFGRIGQKLAYYMKNIVSSICYYDPLFKAESDYEKCFDINDIFSTCNIVSIHAPLTEKTKGMIGSSELSISKELILINTSRAAIVDRDALLSALKAKKVYFYGSDVSWEEPIDINISANKELLSMNQVLITPHYGWYSLESEREVRRKAAMEIARFIKGGVPLNVVS
jgi:D-3-phosphoglycerate dehydrogenase